jgi:hypothetical protein
MHNVQWSSFWTHTQKALARDHAVEPRIMNTTSETKTQKHQKSWDRLKSSSLKKPSVLKEGKQKEQHFPSPTRLTSIPMNRNNRFSNNPIQTHFQKGKRILSKTTRPTSKKKNKNKKRSLKTRERVRESEELQASSRAASGRAGWRAGGQARGARRWVTRGNVE